MTLMTAPTVPARVAVMPAERGYTVACEPVTPATIAAMRAVREAVGREQFQFDGRAWAFRDPIAVVPALARHFPDLDTSRVAVAPRGPSATRGGDHPALAAYRAAGIRRPLYAAQEDALRTIEDLRGNCILCMAMGTGKALTTDTPVLTPTGYRRMGDIAVGDRVIGSNGMPTMVLGVYPQGVRPAYEIEFSDGTTTRCDIEHLWAVRTPRQKYRGQGYQAKTLREIIERGLVMPGIGARFFVPTVEPIDFEGGSLPLDPYLLGILIGDGGLSSGAVMISSADEELLDRVRYVLPDDVSLKFNGRYDWRISRKERMGGSNSVMEALRILGLYGHKAEGKFIPDCYKFASLAEREELLQGLLDTDGHCEKKIPCNIEFVTVSRRLADDVAFLVQSLGGTASIVEKQTTGQLAYRMMLRLNPTIKPFRLSRKADAYRPRTKYLPARSIADVREDGEAEMVCIAVDAPDHCYVIEHGIVTHNTSVAIVDGEIVDGPKLAIVPKAVQKQWADEIRILTGKEANLVRGTKKKREEALRRSPQYSWTVITYEGARDTRELLWSIPFAAAFFDEAQYLKNPKAKRTIACLGHRDDLTPAEFQAERAKNPAFRGRKTWRGGVQAPRKVMLSGTPMMNRPIELWPLLNAIDTAEWGNEWDFKTRYCDMEDIEVPRMEMVAATVARLAPALAGTPYGSLPGEIQRQVPRRTAKRMKGVSNLDELHRRIQPHYHRVKLHEVVGDMPPLTLMDTAVELTPAWQREYDAALLTFEEWLRAQGKDEEAVARSLRAVALAKMNALRQVVLRAKTEQLCEALDTILEGWGMTRDEEGGAWRYDAAQVDEERESVLVFSTYKEPLHALAARYGALSGTIIGEDAGAARDGAREAFQAGKFPILLLTHAAGGVGLNLQRARVVFLLNEDWTPAANEQAIARAYRNGQKRGVTVYTLLVPNTVDGDIHEALALKAEIIANVLDGASAETVSQEQVLSRVLKSLRAQAAAARRRTGADV